MDELAYLNALSEMYALAQLRVKTEEQEQRLTYLYQQTCEYEAEHTSWPVREDPNA